MSHSDQTDFAPAPPDLALIDGWGDLVESQSSTERWQREVEPVRGLQDEPFEPIDIL